MNLIIKGMKPSQKQLKYNEANQTRLVTKCRWVVEAINGIFKQSYKALDQIRNTQLKHIMDDFRIAAALINFLQINLKSDGENDVLIATEMLSKLNDKNKLENVLNLTRNNDKKFTEIDATEIEDFPKLEVETIKNKITLGSYQLKQSFSYLNKHLDQNNGKYLIKLRLEESDSGFKMISALMQSRHSNKTKYKLFIQYSPNLNDYKAINAWVCSCKSGLRTVGCCSHIASVIYYMSYAKYSDNPIPNACKRLNNFLIIPTRESSSEENDSDKVSDEEEKNLNENLIITRAKKKVLTQNTTHLDTPCSSEQSLKRSCTLTLTQYEEENLKSNRITRSLKKKLNFTSKLKNIKLKL
jgi:ABC-type antimicrobial peptide transport system permease subunit